MAVILQTINCTGCTSNLINNAKCSNYGNAVIVTLIINLIILILYRTGYKGEFLGVGGTWNLNEDKNADAEIVASGVLVGFFIYTSVVLITYCFGSTYHKKTLVEIIMNFVGTFMFVAVGGTALHYWHGYQPENKFDTIIQERQILASVCTNELLKHKEYAIPRWLWVIYCIDTSMYCIIYCCIGMTHVFEKPRRLPSACIVGTAVYMRPLEPYLEAPVFGVLVPTFITGYILVHSSDIMLLVMKMDYVYLVINNKFCEIKRYVLGNREDKRSEARHEDMSGSMIPPNFQPRKHRQTTFPASTNLTQKKEPRPRPIIPQGQNALRGHRAPGAESSGNPPPMKNFHDQETLETVEESVVTVELRVSSPIPPSPSCHRRDYAPAQTERSIVTDLYDRPRDSIRIPANSSATIWCGEENKADRRVCVTRFEESDCVFESTWVEILSVFSIGLIVDPLNSFQKILVRSHFKLDDAAIIYIAIGSYMIINTLFIICHMIGDRIPQRSLVILLIFVLVIYTIILADILPIVTCILLIALTGVYVIVLPIDLISQVRTKELKTLPVITRMRKSLPNLTRSIDLRDNRDKVQRDSNENYLISRFQMFLFAFLGTIFFSTTGTLLLSAYSSTWHIIAMACLSLLAFILFMVEIALILAYWRRTCNICQQYCHSKQPEILYEKKFCDPLCTETVKHDLMTSVSSIRVASGDENAEPDHSKRKISYGHRRQYVDCPTSARNLCFLEVADVQTERNQTSSTQSQTDREVKETPVQTVSRCELCNQQIRFSGSPMQPATQQTPCVPCPALVQLLRGTPCCTGCVRGIIQVSRQSQQQQTQRPEQAKQDKEATKDQTRVQPVDDMLTKPIAISRSPGTLIPDIHFSQGNQHQQQDPNSAGVPEIVTKLTLASYCVTPKKIHTSCQTAVPKTM
ncbi:hypothetical protein WN48_10777 [Eufriesea mexicana]|uniref:Uncharacterized protein n=1 Tax=Eufriesea mexicana TaxID=516756 RepID=A0A310S6A0_9HYME|nr:hypothetical protein WN48_10777 [Eufriesea mexicana]